jgi:hypothetical protein
MAKAYSEIDESVGTFIQAQSVFFVATAPLDAGRARLSWLKSRASATHAGMVYLFSSSSGSGLSCGLVPQARDGRAEDLPAGKNRRSVDGLPGVSE